MSLELLYTSAPAGLKPGSRGFTTVICTEGTPSNIAMRLETLSGYRHVYPPQHPQAADNPVTWSHLRLTFSGRLMSVLSRISAYGTDYSGRTNKLAHHVVIEPAEAAAAGPAWALMRPGWMRTAWENICQAPAIGPEVPAGNQPTAACEQWQRFTGDAGWGGIVAEAIDAGGTKPLWIIFAIEQSGGLLQLINESIALLPRSKRWQATFSTNYTNLPPEIDCKIRCVLAGTEEAKLAPARGMVIDLTQQLGVAPESRFSRAARTGESDTVLAETFSGVELEGNAGQVPMHSSRDAIGPVAWHDHLAAPQLELYPAQPPVLPVSPPPVHTTVGKGRRRSIYAALLSAAVMVIATAAWAVSQRRVTESQLLAKPHQVNVPPQQHDGAQATAPAVDQTDSPESREFELFSASLLAEFQHHRIEIEDLAAKVTALRNGIANEREALSSMAKRLDEDFKQIDKTRSDLKQRIEQVEIAASQFKQERNRRETEISADPAKAYTGDVRSLVRDLADMIEEAKTQVDELAEPGSPGPLINKIDSIRIELEEVSKHLRLIEGKGQTTDFREVLKAMTDSPGMPEKRRQLEEMLDAHDTVLADVKKRLASADAEVRELVAKAEHEAAATRNQETLAKAKNKYDQLVQGYSDLRAMAHESQYRLVLSLVTPPVTRKVDRPLQLILSAQTKLVFDGIKEASAVRWNDSESRQPLITGSMLFPVDSATGERQDAMTIPQAPGMGLFHIETDRLSGEMRVRFAIDSFAGRNANAYAPKCVAFIDSCIAVFESAEKCRKWSHAGSTAQGLEADVFSHKVDLPIKAHNLQELVSLLDTYQAEASKSHDFLEAKVAVDSEAKPQNDGSSLVIAKQEARTRLQDIRNLIKSIESCKYNVQELQEGEHISLGKLDLLSPDQDLRPGKRTEANLHFLVVIPQFVK